MGKYSVVGLDAARRTLRDVRLGGPGGSYLRHYPFAHPMAQWHSLLSDADVQRLSEFAEHSDDRLVETRPTSACRRIVSIARRAGSKAPCAALLGRPVQA